MSNKVMGKNTIIKVQPNSSGSFTDVGGESRTFDVDDKASEIDVTVRNSTAKEAEDDYPDITAKMSGLAVKEASGGTPALELLPRGSVGTINWYPEGLGAGKPMKEADYKILGVSESYPYGDAVSWSMDVRLTTEVATTIQA